jgi:Uma2 family endonuclease
MEYAPRRITLDTYLSSAETNRPHELAYGVVREPAAPSWGHQIVVGRVFVRLDRHVTRHALGRVIQSPVDVVLDHERALVVQPDLIFLTAERLALCADRVCGAPDLAVEVLSLGTARHDSTVKLSWFHRYGVRECWLVDPAARRVDVVNCSSAERSTRVFTEDQTIRSAVLPRLRLRVQHMFEDSAHPS